MKKLATFICALALVAVLMPAPRAEAATNYTYYGNQEQLINYLIALIKELQQDIARRQHGGNQVIYQYGYGGSFGDDNIVVGKPRAGNDDDDDNDDEPHVTTKSANDIEDDGAEIRGEVDMNDFEDGEVFFVFGEDESQIEDIEDDYDTYSDIDEDGDDLQKLKVDNDLDDDASYEATISGFDENTDIFYQICVGYEDDDDDDTIACGGVEDFEIGDDSNDDDDDDNDEEPEATTDNAEDVSDDSAELHGSVDMNDFEDGLVFFVYGEDEDQVSDIEDDFNSYEDIDEDGDDLQKIKADDSLDDSKNYWFEVVNLNDATDYFFQICVEWEDDDNDDQLTCGGVEEFTTDE